MRNVENKYKNNVNFITLDGMKASNQDLLRTFKVDGIPHLAFITKVWCDAGASIHATL